MMAILEPACRQFPVVGDRKAIDMATTKKATKRTTRKRVEHDGTLGDLVAAYLVHLEHEGRGQGTIFSYGIELRCACAELGVDTPLADITGEVVQGYFDCDRVTKTRAGTPKSAAGVAKTRRVLRLALVYAADRKWIPSAPIPEPAAKA